MSTAEGTRAYPNDHERLADVLIGQPGVDNATAHMADELGDWVVELTLAEHELGPSPEVLMAVAQAIRQTDIRGIDLSLTREEWGWQKVVIR